MNWASRKQLVSRFIKLGLQKLELFFRLDSFKRGSLRKVMLCSLRDTSQTRIFRLFSKRAKLEHYKARLRSFAPLLVLRLGPQAHSNTVALGAARVRHHPNPHVLLKKLGKKFPQFPQDCTFGTTMHLHQLVPQASNNADQNGISMGQLCITYYNKHQTSAICTFCPAKQLHNLH